MYTHRPVEQMQLRVGFVAHPLALSRAKVEKKLDHRARPIERLRGGAPNLDKKPGVWISTTISTSIEVGALGVITISRGYFERCGSNKKTPP